jgi:hypothetical protein
MARHLLTTTDHGYVLAIGQTVRTRNNHANEFETYRQADFKNNLRDIEITQDSPHELILQSNENVTIDRLIIRNVININFEKFSGTIKELYVPQTKRLKIINSALRDPLEINTIYSNILSHVRNNRAFIGTIDSPALYTLDVDLNESGTLNTPAAPSNIVLSDPMMYKDIEYRLGGIVVDNVEKLTGFSKRPNAENFQIHDGGKLLSLKNFQKEFQPIMDAEQNQQPARNFLNRIAALKV